jgi:hypothetical protein
LLKKGKSIKDLRNPLVMYLCYVDESGDCGAYDPNKPGNTGSPYFIIAGLAVHSSKWRFSLETLKRFRKEIARQAYLKYDVEFHCAEMIDPRKVAAYRSISVSDRWKLIEEYAEVIGQNKAFNIFLVSIDKRNSELIATEYLTTGITMLYQAFDEFLRKEQTNGMILFDRSNEHQINTHVRRLLGTGAGGEIVDGVRIREVIEDPIFRMSADSMFIQSTDVIAYSYKEKGFPQASRQKHQAHKIFDRKLSGICFKSKVADDDGIIRI